jgi:tetratricopeptide (TPR) repeat protein
MSNRVEVCRILLRQDRYELAEKEIGRMLAEDPENDDAHCLMAWCMKNTGRFKEAHEAADHAIRIAPQDSYPYYMKACVFRDEEKYKKSLSLYRRAISLNPEWVYYYSELSNVFLKLGRPKEALAAAKRGLRRDPEYVDCHNARTEALKDLKREKEALQSAEITLALDPQNAKAFRLKGELHLQWEELLEADRAISQSLKLQPVNHRAQKTLGLVEGKWDEMLGDYLWDHKSFKLFPWLVLACLIGGAITRNGAGLMAVVLLMGARAYGVERLKHRPGSPRYRAMGQLFLCLIPLGGVALGFFGTADHWYSDPTAWFFAVLFLAMNIWPKKYLDDKDRVSFLSINYLIGGVLLGVGFFFHSWAWVLTALNWSWFFHVVQKIELKKTDYVSRFYFVMKILSVPAMLYLISDLLGKWDLTQPWFEEIICLALGAYIGNYFADEKKTKEVLGLKLKQVFGGSHE